MKLPKNIIGAVAVGMAAATIMPSCGASKDSATPKHSCKKTEKDFEEQRRHKDPCPACGMG